jgi:hypothetical protein
MTNMNEIYHKKIADQLLSNQIKMIRSISNPEMFDNELQSLTDLHDDILYGGARASAFVQPGNNVQSFDPSTLSVGQNASEYIVGGAIKRKRGRPRKEQGGDIFSTMGQVAKTAAPIALRYGLPMLLGMGIDEKKPRGRPRKIQQVEPIISSQQIVSDLSRGSGLKKRQPNKKELINAILEMQKPVRVKRTRKLKGSGGNFLDTLKHVGSYIKPIAEKVGKDVILPVAIDVGKQALMSSMSGAGIKRKRKLKGSGSSGGNFLDSLKHVGSYIKPIAEKVGKDVILPVAMDVGKQALTSYMSGAGLKMKRRAELVKKIMRESGCTLPEASKYIKQNNLKY